MTEDDLPEDEGLIKARRRFLRASVYVAPLILATVAVDEARAQAVSCAPSSCLPGGSCGPSACPPQRFP
jgi:hypothetical protein